MRIQTSNTTLQQLKWSDMDIEESYTTHHHTIHISTTTSPRYALKPYTIIGFTTILQNLFHCGLYLLIA